MKKKIFTPNDYFQIIERMQNPKYKQEKPKLFRLAQKFIKREKNTLFIYCFLKEFEKEPELEKENLLGLIADGHDPEVNYYTARDIEGCDIPVHEQEVLQANSPIWSLQYLKYVPSANKDAHRQIVNTLGSKELKDALFEYERECEKNKIDDEAE